MSRKIAYFNVFGAILFLALGFKVSSPAVPGFWTWLVLPALMIAAGVAAFRNDRKNSARH